jgi:hypothetical protein
VFADGRFLAQIKVIEVPKSDKFPDGIKLRCVLLDVERNVPRLLLDNHEPFGYHLHTRLPEDKNFRASVDVKDYAEAVRLFIAEARKVVADEK